MEPCTDPNHSNHSDVTFTPWTNPSALPTDEGNYYLDTDVELDNYWGTSTGPSKTFNLCLNGHKIVRKNEGTSYGAIVVSNNTILNLCDCDATEHKFAVNSTTGQWTLDEDSGTETIYGGYITSAKGNSAVQVFDTLNLYSGNIVGTVAENGGGVNVGGNGKFNMFGGNIVGNSASTTGGTTAIGGGVYNMGTFKLYGGTIAENRAVNDQTFPNAKAGGVFTNGNFTMTGGSITGNQSANNGGGLYVEHANDDKTTTISGDAEITGNTAINGGGIFISGASTTVNISGGEISGNEGTNGYNTPNKMYTTAGGIHLYMGTLNLSGDAKITDNTNGGVYVAGRNPGTESVKFTVKGNVQIWDNTGRNVYLAGGSADSLAPITLSDALTEGASFGVTMRDPSVGDFTSGWNTHMSSATPTDYFASDDPGYLVTLNSDASELKLKAKTVVDGISIDENGTATINGKTYNTSGTATNGGPALSTLGLAYSYTDNKATLTISGEDVLIQSSTSSAISSEVDLEIVLENDAEVVCSSTQSNPVPATIENLHETSLTISGGKTLNVKRATSGNNDAYAIYTQDLTVAANTTVDVFARSDKEHGLGIQANNTLTNNGTIKVNSDHYSIYVKGLTNNGTIDIQCAWTWSAMGVGGTPMHVKDTLTNSGTITAEGYNMTKFPYTDNKITNTGTIKLKNKNTAANNTAYEGYKFDENQIVKGDADAVAYEAAQTDAAHNSSFMRYYVAEDPVRTLVITYNPPAPPASNPTHYPNIGGSSTGTSYVPEQSYAVRTGNKTANGTFTVSQNSSKKDGTVTITVKPDAGYVADKVTVLDASGNPVAVRPVGENKYEFTMPNSKVTVDATFKPAEAKPVQSGNPFVDVAEGAYYYDAVLWAAENGITGGVDATHFAPTNTVTRGQVVTFLWRAAGCPEPKAMSSFTDVAPGSYYEKAVAWAVANGITLGTSTTTFSPNATCTRGQIVTFLYRYNAMDTLNIKDNPFTDVAEGAYYHDAVLWAGEYGITGGTSATTFSPNNDCSRAQVVTFLWRYMG